MAKPVTPWLGENADLTKRPVKGSNPTAKQIALTVMQEYADPGYLVSFHQDDVIDYDHAMKVLAREVLKSKNEEFNQIRGSGG